MKTRPFGASGMETSEIGIGCAGIGALFSKGVTHGEQTRMLRAAFDSGIRFYDTADLYSQGQSEILLGKALAKDRDKVIIATKGGYLLPPRRRLLSRIKPILRPAVQALGLRRRPGASAGGALGQNFTPSYLATALEASLKRLGTEYVDLYQLHSPPPLSALQWEDVLERLESLRAQGKIRCLGVALDDAGAAQADLVESTIGALQLPVNLLHRDALEDLLPRAKARGIAAIARSCFAAGLLGEKRTAEELKSITPDWERIVELRAKAKRLGRAMLELALQFNLAQPAICVTILGMTSPAHLAQSLHWYEAPPLSDDELELLTEREAAEDRQASAAGAGEGRRER